MNALYTLRSSGPNNSVKPILYFTSLRHDRIVIVSLPYPFFAPSAEISSANSYAHPSIIRGGISVPIFCNCGIICAIPTYKRGDKLSFQSAREQWE